MFPKHKFGLFLSQDSHKSSHLTLAEYLALKEAEPDWVSEEQKKKAIEADTFWELVWYPDNAVGSYRLLACDLDVLLEVAKQTE